MPRDWDAATYDRLSEPQRRWGEAVLGRLDLAGAERVLDAGCGTGRVTELLRERLPDGEVVALDASASMIERARERLGARSDDVRDRRPHGPLAHRSGRRRRVDRDVPLGARSRPVVPEPRGRPAAGRTAGGAVRRRRQRREPRRDRGVPRTRREPREGVRHRGADPRAPRSGRLRRRVLLAPRRADRRSRRETSRRSCGRCASVASSKACRRTGAMGSRARWRGGCRKAGSTTSG